MGGSTKYDREFDAAKMRWESIIVNDIRNINKQGRSDFDWFGGFFDKKVNVAVDDVLIGYSMQKIDGSGGILGSAGARYVRSRNKIPISGVMRFDEDDFDNMSPTDAKIIILHEMGHVLGLVGSAGSCNDQCSRQYENKKGAPYSCSKAKEQYEKMRIPGKDKDDLLLNRRGGKGSRCAHWDDTSFDNPDASELMTAFFKRGKEQLITAASLGALEDISENGYICNYTEADVYPVDQDFALTDDDFMFTNEDDLMHSMHALVPDHDFTISDRMIELGEPEIVYD
jgi:hypothetical protein